MNKIFKDDEEAEELEKQILASNLSEHNKLMVIRCIEAANDSTISNYFYNNQTHYKEVLPEKRLKEDNGLSGPICSVRGLS